MSYRLTVEEGVNGVELLIERGSDSYLFPVKLTRIPLAVRDLVWMLKEYSIDDPVYIAEYQKVDVIRSDFDMTLESLEECLELYNELVELRK